MGGNYLLLAMFMYGSPSHSRPSINRKLSKPCIHGNCIEVFPRQKISIVVENVCKECYVLTFPKVLLTCIPNTPDMRSKTYHFMTPEKPSENTNEIAFHLFHNHQNVDSLVMKIVEKIEPPRQQDNEAKMQHTDVKPEIQKINPAPILPKHIEEAQILQSLNNSGKPFVAMQMMLRKGCNSPWEASNFVPDKIGKMRKLKFQLNNLPYSASITAVSSDPKILQVLLSNASRRFSDNPKNVTINIPSTCMDQSYYILIDPKIKNATATLTVFLVVETSDRPVFTLYKHTFTTAGHKYESGKRALNKAMQNSGEKTFQISLSLEGSSYHPEKQIIPNPLSKTYIYSKAGPTISDSNADPWDSDTDEDEMLIIDESRDEIAPAAIRT